jgi:hypothetical protein
VNSRIGACIVGSILCQQCVTRTRFGLGHGQSGKRDSIKRSDVLVLQVHLCQSLTSVDLLEDRRA